MRIGIDITPAVENPHTGIGRYTQRLVEQIVNIDTANEYCLFRAPGGRAPNTFYEKLAGDNTSLRVFFSSKRYTRALWLASHKLRIGIDAFFGTLDLFHAPSTCGPRLSRIRSVITVHDTAFLTLPDTAPTLNRYYLSNSIHASLKNSELVITVSNSTKRDLIHLFGLPEEKVRVVYLGVDDNFRPEITPHYQAEVKTKYGLTSPFILFVGTIQPRKNLITLIKAYHALIGEYHIEHSLVIAGRTGWSSEPFFSLIRELGIDDRVVFTGEISDEDLPALYRGADLFVFPSLYEGFGLPPLEAMACGTPTIIADVSSLPEITGDAALKVTPTDPGELVKAIMVVLEDKSLRGELVAKGLQRVKMFSWQKMAEETIKVYEEAVDLQRAHAHISPWKTEVPA